SEQCQVCREGKFREDASSILTTFDGGYIFTGVTSSSDGDVVGFHGITGDYNNTADVWVVKLNSAGAVRWQTCLGGSGFDYGNSIVRSIEGGYCIIGYTNSPDSDVSGLHIHGGGNDTTDMWMVKIDDSGKIQWQKCLG